MGTNVYFLSDFAHAATPSYRRRGASSRDAQVQGAWGALARSRGAQKMAAANHDLAAASGSVVPLSAVRITRLPDSAQHPTATGRLRISGRLADVCAELDRLAEAEASLARRA